jgi:CBS domain-containing protein/PII-like signaling protein
MNLTAGKPAKRVRFYINESDHVGAFPLPMRLIEVLRRHNAAGATMLRGGIGFGSSGRIHTVNIVDLATELPVVVEWIDTPERVDQLLPELLSMVTPGLVTVEDTFVALCTAQPIRDVSSELRVGAVMVRDPVFVSPDTMAREIVDRMREGRLRGIPVVEDGIPIGIITGSDLIERAGLGVRMSLLPGLDAHEVGHTLDRLHQVVARDIMTAPVVVVPESLPLSQVASIMVMHKLKRLPVVDERGALVGILSRVDILRTVTDAPERARASEHDIKSNGDVQLEKLMRRDVPTVFSDTLIAQVVQAVVSTRLNRALVVDAQRHVVGLITGLELLQRVTPALRPSALAALMHRLPFLHPSSEEVETERHARASTARDLMTTNFVTAKPDTHLQAVVTTMVQGTHKLVAVVDKDERLLGVVDRADVLRGMLSQYRV